ncbi:MAG: hypothetical protein Q9M43_00255 [Sulfurimonas sp.]|nr:hypothetical protein [Sulfurimonas sp.]
MMHRLVLLAIISLDILLLIFQTSTISISAHEASLLYGDFSFIQWIEKLSISLFGNHDLALRSPMILFHVLSVLLLYGISKKYLTSNKDRLWNILIFILLPGIVSSALMVDSAGFVIFSLLLFIYIYENFTIKYTYPLLLLLSISDGAFIYLFMSLIFFSYYKKYKTYFILNISLFILSIYIYGIQRQGSPRGHLLDTIGLYSAIFTPIIFIYIFYILYRKFLSKEMSILWFISAVPLLISILLSFRQNIYIADFAPYFIMALPLATQTFLASYKVRLPIFRKKYKIIFISSFIFLLVNFFLVIFNRELYIFIQNPQKHFARKMHIAKELSQELKRRNIPCISTEKSMSQRLNFYGIDTCNKFLLYQVSLDAVNTKETVTISYKYRPIYKAIVTNINTQ